MPGSPVIDFGQTRHGGYREEPGVARQSDVETFCALRLFIDSWRWQGVPWYLRSGKCLAETATEVIVQLKPTPRGYSGFIGRPSRGYCRKSALLNPVFCSIAPETPMSNRRACSQNS